MAKKRKRKIKYGRILVLLFIFCLLAFLGIMAYGKLNVKEEKTKKVKNISTIKEYDYVLKENATGYYKKLFKKLDSVLNKDKVDEEEYMNLACQMFVSDFFNLDNKVSKNDVGGVQFVYKDYQSDFEKYAMDSMYKSVESNVYGNRRQDLPIVEEVLCSKVKSETFKYGESSDDKAYVVDFDIKYKEDLGYQTEGSLIIIHNGKKLEVASMNSEKSSS